MSEIIEKNKGGQPEKIQEKELIQLKEAFAFGCTDMEAINYMNLTLGYKGKDQLSERTFYNYQDRHPEFLQEKNALKDNPILQAQKAIVDVITTEKSIDEEGNEIEETPGDRAYRIEMSKWYLSRKKKAEFGNKLIEINNNQDNRSINLVKDDPRVFKTLTKAYQAMVKNAKDITADEQRTE